MEKKILFIIYCQGKGHWLLETIDVIPMLVLHLCWNLLETTWNKFANNRIYKIDQSIYLRITYKSMFVVYVYEVAFSI